MKTIRIACDTKDQLSIDEITPFQGKLKFLPKKNYAKLKAEILTTGFAFPIYIWKGVKGSKYIIGGHQRFSCLTQMKEEGFSIPKIPVVYIEAASAKEAKRRILQDVSQYGEISKEGLHDFMNESGISIDDMVDSFSVPDGEMDMGSFKDAFFNGSVSDQQDKEDFIPSVPKKPKTKIGDIYHLGDHRLICGDSSDAKTMSKLMGDGIASLVFTDPPYGISYQSNMRKKSEKFDQLKNDDQFISDWIPILPKVSKGWVFVWTTWKVIDKWLAITKSIGDMSNLIIWDKGGGGIGDLQKTFSTDYEIALVFNRGSKITGKRVGSVWSVGKDGAANYLHPTQKPVALADIAIDNCTTHGDIVLDFFGGSGSTLISAEKNGRRAFLAELDPRYCDVIVNRWETFAKKKAKLIKRPS